MRPPGPEIRRTLLVAAVTGVAAGTLTGTTVAHGWDATLWLTGALVLITAYYAILTHRLADEATSARLDERTRALERREGAEEALRRAQAERIAAWVRSWDRTNPGGDMHDVVEISVRNPTDLPIYGVHVGVSDDWDGNATIGDRVDVIGPGETYETKIGAMLTEPHIAPPITLYFVDVANVGWKRFPDGRLFEDDFRPGDARPRRQ